MGQADELRKVMGKKQKDKIPVYREKFIDGCAENGIGAQLAADIFAFIEPFAGYGFNKSHAAAYGWISYQTGYLKANYPLQYFAALMSSVRDKTDKLVEYIEEAKKMGIAVLPPDVNESLVDFAVVGSQIRFGLAAVKGVGEGAVDAILAARERDGKFTDLFDVDEARRDQSGEPQGLRSADQVRRARHAAGQSRAAARRARRRARCRRARVARPRARSELALRHARGSGAGVHAGACAPLPAPSTMVALTWEKETLGIFVSGHPLADVAEALARTGATAIKDLRGVEDDSPVRIAGLVTAVRRTLTKAQQQMLIATIEDMTGSIECIVFPEALPAAAGRVRRGCDRRHQRPPALARTPRRRAGRGDAGRVQRVGQRGAAVRSAKPRRPSFRAGTSRSRRAATSTRSRSCSKSRPAPIPLVFHISGQTKRSSRGIANAPYVKSELERIVGPANVRIGYPQP